MFALDGHNQPRATRILQERVVLIHCSARNTPTATPTSARFTTPGRRCVATTSLFPASTTMFVKIDKEKEMPVTREGASCSPRPQRGGCGPNGEGRFPVGATAAAGTTL